MGRTCNKHGEMKNAHKISFALAFREHDVTIKYPRSQQTASCVSIYLPTLVVAVVLLTVVHPRRTLR